MREALGGKWRTAVRKCVPRQRTTRPQGLAQGLAQELTLAHALVAPCWPQALAQGATSARGNSVTVWERQHTADLVGIDICKPTYWTAGERFVSSSSSKQPKQLLSCASMMASAADVGPHVESSLPPPPVRFRLDPCRMNSTATTLRPGDFAWPEELVPCPKRKPPIPY